jgi:predicted DNA-binding ArsR family transcriptional regulator
MARKYLPTLGELIDRLTIVQLKEVKIPQHKEEYQKEIEEIVHDITEILTTTKQLKIDGDFIRAVIVLAQMNTHIWVNEDNARSGDEQ